MDLIVSLIDKILYLAFFMSVLCLIKHVGKFLKELMKKDPQKLTYSKTDLLFTAVSLSYILTCIFNGIKL